MNKVFRESEIAGIVLKNRILRSATHEGMCDERGRPTEGLIKKYVALAKGGVGAIITGFTGIRQDGRCDNMLMLDTDDNIKPFEELVNRVHAQGTPIILQVAHCGRQTRSKVTGYRTVAPSAIRDNVYSEDIPHELTDTEILEIVDDFVYAIERAKKAGFDGVQLQAAHGYLLSSFLSPHMNKRSDRWGGTTENRSRIIREIILEARKVVGSYPILAKINAFEQSKDGLKIAEAIEIAKCLEAAGCDAIEVSSGVAEDGFSTTRGDVPFDLLVRDHFRLKKLPKILRPVVKPLAVKWLKSPKPYALYNVAGAEAIKAHVKIPVIVVGGIRTLQDIEDIIEQNRCDFVAMARPFIIEPGIVNRFREGKQAESRCINCNFCVVGVEERPLKCYYGRVSNG